MAAGNRGRWIALILAISVDLRRWSFLWNRYATINWAIAYVAPAFAVEGYCCSSCRCAMASPSTGAGLPDGPDLMLGFALAGQPLLAPLFGRDWAASEVFGIAPDPTAIATLGLLLSPAAGCCRCCCRSPCSGAS